MPRQQAIASHCYIGIGSNLNDPQNQVGSAIENIAKITDCELLRASPWVGSFALGPGVQPNFVNAVVEVKTLLEPLQLLEKLQSIETLANRQRVERWGPRTLDLDILLYAELQINTEQITIPHPHLAERDFVVIPLLSIAPDLKLPDGKALHDIAEKLGVSNGRTANCWRI